MSPTDVLAILTKLVKNPYLDTYLNMPEYELSSWKYVFEASIALGASNREKHLRLRAVNRTLKGIEGAKLARAA
ncbi:MAG: hypothetical protein ACHQAY_01645 [Hyphomicrobiales bacterium]